MTFSVLGRCAESGMVGVAITTSSIAVGARCPFVRAGVGAVSTQNITDPSLGPRILDRLAAGEAAAQALDAVMGETPLAGFRQVAVIDAEGRTATFTGDGTLGTHAIAEGRDVVAAGNLLDNPGIPAAMVAAFEASAGDGQLAGRLVAALQAGHDAGGEEGPVKSANLIIAHEQPWPLVDLRIDWDDDPLARLADLWRAYEPEMDAYVSRALDPGAAPSYGVPGDP